MLAYLVGHDHGYRAEGIAEGAQHGHRPYPFPGHSPVAQVHVYEVHNKLGVDVSAVRPSASPKSTTARGLSCYRDPELRQPMLLARDIAAESTRTSSLRTPRCLSGSDQQVEPGWKIKTVGKVEKPTSCPWQRYSLFSPTARGATIDQTWLTGVVLRCQCTAVENN